MVLTDVVRPVMRDVLYLPTEDEFGSAFHPTDLGTAFFGAASELTGLSSTDPVDAIGGFSASGSARPTYTEGGGLAWLAFDGSTQYMTQDIALTQGFTLFAVARAGNLTSIGTILGDNSPLTDIRCSTSEVYQISAGTVLSDTNGYLDQDAVIIGLFNGASSTLRVNGNERTGNAGTNNPNGFGLGARYTTSLPFLGRIYEFGAVDRIINATEIAQLEARAVSKYGVTLV